MVSHPTLSGFLQLAAHHMGLQWPGGQLPAHIQLVLEAATSGPGTRLVLGGQRWGRRWASEFIASEARRAGHLVKPLEPSKDHVGQHGHAIWFIDEPLVDERPLAERCRPVPRVLSVPRLFRQRPHPLPPPSPTSFAELRQRFGSSRCALHVRGLQGLGE